MRRSEGRCVSYYVPSKYVTHTPFTRSHTHTCVALDVEIDLLLASLDAARWSLAGAEKDGRRRLREAVQIARGVRAEIKDVEGMSAMGGTNDVISHTRARRRRRRQLISSFFSLRPQNMFSLARWRRLVSCRGWSTLVTPPPLPPARFLSLRYLGHLFSHPPTRLLLVLFCLWQASTCLSSEGKRSGRRGLWGRTHCA